MKVHKLLEEALHLEDELHRYDSQLEFIGRISSKTKNYLDFLYPPDLANQ
jgi:hypothetical protein